MASWNKIFREKGLDYHSPTEDLENLVQLLREKRIRRILDLGCGSGRHLAYLAERNFEGHGMDTSEEGISQSRKNSKRDSLPVHLTLSSIYERLPYRDCTFDAIICLRALHHGRESQIKSLVEEMERVLRPKGVVYITVPKVDLSRESKTPTRQIEPRTVVNLEGEEKGVVHYLYDENTLLEHFRSYKAKLWVDSHGYYCLLGELRGEKKMPGGIVSYARE